MSSTKRRGFARPPAAASAVAAPAAPCGAAWPGSDAPPDARPAVQRGGDVRNYGRYPMGDDGRYPKIMVFRDSYWFIGMSDIWVNYNDLTALPHWKSSSVRGIIPFYGLNSG